MLKKRRSQLTNTSPTQALQNGPAVSLSNGQLVSRIFTDQSGQQFNLTFFVSIVDGEVRGHLVSAQKITTGYELGGRSYENTSTILCLPFDSSKIIAQSSYLISPALLVSPYRELYFFMSQPTRAPAFA